jgi:uncharacterized membrane protein
LAAVPQLTARNEASGAIQAISGRGLLGVAVRADCVLVLLHGVGDFVPAGAALMEVHGSGSDIGTGTGTGTDVGDVHLERQLRGMVALGVERTIEQDPAFAVRILVDVAIRALSPAVNDPTTAIQVLNYLEDFLHTLAGLPLQPHYAVADSSGRVRIVLPGRGWSEFLSLATTEIRVYGATSPQVCRRLRAVLEGLLQRATAEQRPAISAELARLDLTIVQNYPDADASDFARQADGQGIGGRSSEEDPPKPTELVRPRISPSSGDLSPQPHDAELLGGTGQ